MKPRSRVRLAAIAVLSMAALGLPVAPAVAAPDLVSTITELNTALATPNCAGTSGAPTEVALSASIIEPGDQVGVAADCVVILDLAGHDLTVRNIRLRDGSDLTVRNSGSAGALTADASGTANVAGIGVPSLATLRLVADGTTATGGSNAAGIGGNGNSTSGRNSAGAIVIDGDDTTATGGGDGASPSILTGGAGIGGSQEGHAGQITINGDRTEARGGGHAAGIGGGARGTTGVIVINGDDTEAYGATNAAGIGGGNQGRVDTIEILGDRTVAQGADGGAGIGSGYLSKNTSIKISGNGTEARGGPDGGAGVGSGSVSEATDNSSSSIELSGTGTVAYGGGGLGAAIGGGSFAAGGIITFKTGSTTTAIASSTTRMAAAIGGGWGKDSSPGQGEGGQAIIEAGATVTASGGATVVGHGHIASSPTSPSLAGDFGSLVVDGTLRIPDTSDELRIPDSDAGNEVIVGSSGLITGAVATPTSGAEIRGDTSGSRGQIENSGIIALDTSQITGGSPAIQKVYENHYRLTFDSAGSVSGDPSSFTLFAPTVASGERTWPADPTPPTGLVFEGWFQQGTSQQVTSTTDISALVSGSSDGNRVPIDLEAHYGSPPPPSSGGGGGSGGAGSTGGTGGSTPETGDLTATPTPTPTPSATTEPTSQPSTPASTPEPSETPEPEGTSDDMGVWPWVVGGIAAVLLLILIGFLLLRRRS